MQIDIEIAIRIGLPIYRHTLALDADSFAVLRSRSDLDFDLARESIYYGVATQHCRVEINAVVSVEVITFSGKLRMRTYKNSNEEVAVMLGAAAFVALAANAEQLISICPGFSSDAQFLIR